MTHVSQRRYKFGQDTHEAKNVVSEPCNKGEGIDTHRQRTGLIPCYAGPGPRPYSLLACKRFGQSRYLISSSTKGRDGAKCPLGMPPSASESIRALWQRCKHLKFLCSWQGTYPSFFVLVHWIYPFSSMKTRFFAKVRNSGDICLYRFNLRSGGLYGWKNLSFDTKRRGFCYFTDLFSCEMA